MGVYRCNVCHLLRRVLYAGQHTTLQRMNEENTATTNSGYLLNKKGEKKRKPGTSRARLSSHFPLVIPSKAITAAGKQENKRHFRRIGTTDTGGGWGVLTESAEQQCQTLPDRVLWIHHRHYAVDFCPLSISISMPRTTSRN